MNSINSTILSTLFMQLFFGTTIACVALAVLALMRWGEPGAALTLAGGAIYVIGMFLVMVVFNVPLKNELARADPADADTAAIWARYLKDWSLEPCPDDGLDLRVRTLYRRPFLTHLQRHGEKHVLRPFYPAQDPARQAR